MTCRLSKSLPACFSGTERLSADDDLHYERIKVNEHILDDDKYLLIFSVEEVNRLAREGMPFRDAYKKVGLDIEAGNFSHSKEVHHTHEGSIGNLCNDEVSA